MRWLKKQQRSMVVESAALPLSEPVGAGVAKVLMLLPFLAIPYVGVSMLQPHYKSRQNQYAFRLEVDDAKPAGWTGLNSAVIKSEKLQRWFERGRAEYKFDGMQGLAEFTSKRGADLQAIILENEKIAIVLKDSAALLAFPDQSKACPLCPVFELRVQASLGQEN